MPPSSHRSQGRRARRRRAPRWRHALVVLATTGVVAASCSLVRDEDKSLTPAGPEAPAVTKTTPEPAPPTLERAPFCDLLDEQEVRRALGGPIAGTHHYGNGEEAELAPGYTDISHEFNCTFDGGAGASARAWLFARPVAADEAATLVRRTRSSPGCDFPDSAGFGSPAAAVELTSVCRPTTPEPVVRARVQGLFGDSWLTCELTLPERDGSQATARAEDWCTDVARSIAARP